jgi:hypothetical protein
MRSQPKIWEINGQSVFLVYDKNGKPTDKVMVYVELNGERCGCEFPAEEANGQEETRSKAAHVDANHS